MVCSALRLRHYFQTIRFRKSAAPNTASQRIRRQGSAVGSQCRNIAPAGLSTRRIYSKRTAIITRRLHALAVSQSRSIDGGESRRIRSTHSECMPRSTSRLSAVQVVRFFQLGSPIRSASRRATSGTPSGIHVPLSSHLDNPRIEEQAEDRIVLLSQGLPHYAHLLGLHAARSSLLRGKGAALTLSDVDHSVRKGPAGAQQSTRNAFHKATSSPRPENLYKQVLSACALAGTDELGYLAAVDVRGPMQGITGRQYGIPAFARHIKQFCGDRRGRILERIGPPVAIASGSGIR